MSKTTWSPRPRSIALLAGVCLLAAGVASAGQAREPLTSTDQLRVDRTAVPPSGGLAQLEYLTEEWAPFNYAQNGVAAGISVDILQAALRYAGADPSRLNVRIVPLAEGLRAAQQGPGKVLFAIARTPAREPLYKWAGPFTKASFVLYAPTRNNVRIAAPGDLGQYRIGAVTSSVENDLLASRGVDPTRIVNRATPAELLNMLEQGQIDLWATGDLAGRHQMLRTAVNPNAFEVVHTLSENDLYYVFSRDVPDFQVDTFQQALRAVRDLKDAHGVSEYERVIFRNLGVGCARQTFTDASVVALVEATAIDIAGDAPATLRHINARQAPYRNAADPGLYVFVYDARGTLVAHADNPSVVGMNMRGKVDVVGTPLHDRIHDGAARAGAGWVDYVYVHPAQPNLYHKSAFFRRTRGSDGRTYVVAAGNYKRCE